MSSFLKLVIDKFIDNLIGKVICDFPGGALNKSNYIQYVKLYKIHLPDSLSLFFYLKCIGAKE